MLIKIKNLQCQGVIGIHEEERKAPQPIIVNMEINYNSRQAAKSDNIDEAVDYDDICKQVSKIISDSKFNLLETLAETLADKITQDKRIKKLQIELDKPNAIDNAASVSITHFVVPR